MKLLIGKEAEKYVKGLPIAESVIVTKEDEIAKAIDKIKFPMAVKIISAKAVHKTDIGGVIFVHHKDELMKAWNDFHKIAKKHKFRLEGVLFQEFVPGEWIFIGIKKDKTFGHVIMLGIGGIHVEIIKDVTFRACPINDEIAQKMIDELKYKAIIYGARGKPLNIELLKKVMIKASQIPSKHDIEELDINPIVLNDKDGKIVDVRVLL